MMDHGEGAPGRAARFDNIDALRAVAILTVIAFHYTTRFDPGYYLAAKMPFSFPAGQYGVDLFFMVSGFCIFMTLERSKTLAKFWAKRVARLQPAYWAAVILTFTMVSLVGLPGREVGFATMLGNLIWLNATPKVEHVDGVYWTLVIELKFYFWFGLVYFLMRGRRVAEAWAAFSAVAMAMLVPRMLGLPLGKLIYHVGDMIFIARHAPAFLVGIIAY